jgi:hypothetical protein
VNIADLALERQVLKVIADEVAARIQSVNEQLTAGFKTTGTTQAAALLPDGKKVASVSYAGLGSKAALVTDERAFTDWVQAEYPGEVVTRVREDSRKKWLDGAKAAGAPIDTRTGQVIPGVEVRDRSPYISGSFARGGAAAIVDAWLAGKLTVDLVEPPAIEGAA